MIMESLEGLIERITFFNPENGYTVLRLKVKGRVDPVTVVGNLPELAIGESLRLHGRWSNHATYGRQFQAERCEQVLPATTEGIRRYLGSGLIKGIGPRTADKIVDTFGPETLYVIDSQPQRLREVPDIGQKRYRIITEAWQTQKAIKEVMVFLQGHGISAGLAIKVYKQYGDGAIRVVQSDPYRLARDIWGIGFKTADKIARALGLPTDAPSRLEAGLVFVLSEFADEGHTFVPQPELFNQASTLLEIPPEALRPALTRLIANERVRRDKVAEHDAIYLPPFLHAEAWLAMQLKRVMNTPARPMQLALTRFNADLSPEQMNAVQMAMESKVSILTGGPGTGKTTTLRALIVALEMTGRRYALASPTGRAAKRLSQATGREAKTIHRLLGYSPDGTYKHNEDNPLDIDMLVVDETSMLDLILAYHLLKAVPAAARVLLVGDVDQLPSVGAGDVLRDIIRSGCVPVTRLTSIFRQAEGSGIIQNAHRIIHGQMPIFNKNVAEGGDFFLFEQEEEAEVAKWVVEVVSNRVPARFGLDPLREVIVLSPMYRGSAGVGALNENLQAVLNPSAPDKAEKTIGGRTFRVGDRVMQLRNNYNHDVYNGDIGQVTGIDLEMQRLEVNFEGTWVEYDWTELDEITHAYAASVHKVQGSEYPAVVLALLPRHYMLLQRNLLYTAVTRAQKLGVIIGSRRAIAMAVNNDKVAQRWSGLEERLKAD
jgi:exodeoxyribonuclease V alpha subunit